MFRRTGEANASKGAVGNITTPEPRDGRPDPGLSTIMSERRQLINLAYRLLGSLADAEDVVQETYAGWYAMSPQQHEAIEKPGAWLMKVASRICLDLLGSARARRERYVGEWIPSRCPIMRSGPVGGPAAPRSTADRVTLDESINMAFLVVLESMTLAERVAFILHDVFRYPFAGGRDRRPYASGLSPAGLVGPPSHSCVAGAGDSDSPAGRHRQELQAGMGGQ